MKYKILYSLSSFKLETLVNEAINNEWKPVGGVCVSSIGDFNELFYQAMVIGESK